MKDGHEDVVKVGPGISLTIPVGTHFQFRNTGSEPFRFIIATMPPWWPGVNEAFFVEGQKGGDLDAFIIKHSGIIKEKQWQKSSVILLRSA
jgi:hypothetical protein